MVSVFGVIFAPDAKAAVAEMARVTAGRGRIVLCAWIPAGPLSDLVALRARAVSAASPSAPAGSPPFTWHDAQALARAFGRHGLSVELSEHALAFSAASPEAFIDAELAHHPSWIDARHSLTAPEVARVRDRALELLVHANEEPGAFQVTSRYVIAVAKSNPRRDRDVHLP